MKTIKKKINQKTDSLSFISWNCKIFKEIENETLTKNRENADIVIEHLNNWFDTIRPIIKKNPQLYRSLIGVRFCETFTDMQLTVLSIFSGCYFQAVRNMRFTFESMIHAMYIETKYPELFPDVFLELIERTDEKADFEELFREQLKKIYPESPHRKNKFRDVTSFSPKIIEELPFSSHEKQSLNNTYHKLSCLVHPAPDQIKKIISHSDLIFTFFYEESFFNECVKLTDEVMDMTFAIVLNKFPDVKQNMKLKENALLYDSLGRLPITNRILNGETV